MPRPLGLTEHGMEAQASIRRLRREVAPMYEAALLSRNAAAIAEAKAVAESLRIAGVQARRLTGIAEGLVLCPDGLFDAGHGAAA